MFLPAHPFSPQFAANAHALFKDQAMSKRARLLEPLCNPGLTTFLVDNLHAGFVVCVFAFMSLEDFFFFATETNKLRGRPFGLSVIVKEAWTQYLSACFTIPRPLRSNPNYIVDLFHLFYSPDNRNMRSSFILRHLCYDCLGLVLFDTDGFLYRNRCRACLITDQTYSNYIIEITDLFKRLNHHLVMADGEVVEIDDYDFYEMVRDYYDDEKAGFEILPEGDLHGWEWGRDLFFYTAHDLLVIKHEWETKQIHAFPIQYSDEDEAFFQRLRHYSSYSTWLAEFQDNITAPPPPRPQ